jgi:hypothetical protein
MATFFLYLAKCALASAETAACRKEKQPTQYFPLFAV